MNREKFIQYLESEIKDLKSAENSPYEPTEYYRNLRIKIETLVQVLERVKSEF